MPDEPTPGGVRSLQNRALDWALTHCHLRRRVSYGATDRSKIVHELDASELRVLGLGGVRASKSCIWLA